MSNLDNILDHTEMSKANRRIPKVSKSRKETNKTDMYG